MPRRKIERNLEEEKEFQRIRREKNAEYQRIRRQKLKDQKKLESSENATGALRVNSLVQSEVLHVDNSSSCSYSGLERIQNYDARQKGLINVDISIDNETTTIRENYLGKMDVLCQHCDAKHFKGEKVGKGNSFNDCCSHGETSLDLLPEFPPDLKSLLLKTHSKSVDFFKNIRSYNSSFSFASFNTKLVNFQSRRPGPYCFKIQGQIYYQINTALYPEPNENPSFGQLFIVDANEAVNYRSDTFGLDNELLRLLENMMRDCNILAKSYQMMGEEIKIQRQKAIENNDTMPELQLLFTLKPGMDRNRYNFQRTNEVAAVFSTSADGEIPESYLVIRDINTKTLQYVSSMDANVEPMIYPIFYPYGNQGWHRDIKRENSDKRVSRGAYVKYRIAVRDNKFNPYLLGERLFQQWVVDSYVKVERDRLEYCKANQKKLRVDSYQGLMDYMKNSANQNNTNVGKMVILPSTFSGSPRNMMQHYQDAMTLVRKHGKPDIFLTMTCNPNWAEIEENLFKNQTAADRPDLVARVFSLKVKFLIDLIVRQKFFGEVLSFVYVIEFQKRGLPHIHLLIILKPNSKINTVEKVDHYISAEIPDPNLNPDLHEIVMKNMIHGPCGDWCLVNEKCSKHYPKEYCENTVINENEGVRYSRRNTGITYNRPGNYSVDNGNVVPYCPVLLLLLRCHVNVEIVIDGQKSAKYLYKYIYKGHDASAIEIGEINHDEIKDFLETRYVGPVEAIWRILNKNLQKKSHSICRLPVHLPNEQNIAIDDTFDGKEIESILNRAINQATMLLDYFALNARDVNAKSYYYTDIPLHYRFKKTKINGKTVSQWQPRKSKFKVIGRMYSVNPSQVELFHLRLLLLSVKGAKSFEDLRTVNNEILQTFTEACIERGLIENDDEWKRALQEATVWMMPQSLRRLFIRILIHCNPLHPNQLWEEFKEPMSEDYVRKFGPIQGENKAYAELNSMLLLEGWSISNFSGMPEITDFTEVNDNGISSEVSTRIGLEQFEKLNEDQKEIVSTILTAVNSDGISKCTCFYVDGPGGSGKTFVYTTLWHLLKSKEKQVCAMAFTGIAATLLPNGKTVHKTFGLPVPLFCDSTSNIKVQSKEGQYLKNIDVFIWDEAPMAPRYALEVMDRTLRDVMKNDIPFGGKIVVLGGDFRQLLPIKENGTRSEIINLSIKFSFLWKYFKIFSLTKNMRVLPDEIEFSNFLLNLGNGTLNDINDNLKIPKQIIANANSDIVHEIYGKLIRDNKFNEISECAILSARNADVNDLNNKVVELLDATTEKIYTSIDTIENDGNNNFSETILPEYLNSLSPPSLPLHELRLRVNSVIMLIRNLSVNEGLCNGTRLLVLELTNNLLRCKILTGDKFGDIVFINRITLYCENFYPFTFKRRQFPIKLSFAMTINKSQGQTFTKIAIDLRKDVFNHGQLYVACSRVRKWNALKVFLGSERNTDYVKNYVYRELNS